MSEQAPPGPPESPGSPGAPVPATATKQEEKSEASSRSFGQTLRDSILEGNSVTVIFLAIFTAIVIGGLLNAFTNTTVLHAWGNFFSAPGAAISRRRLRGAVRGVDLQPAHGDGTVPAGLVRHRHS
jgi:hypothetical protein